MANWESLEGTPPGHRSGFVALMGRPNVGKSTLLNQILRQKVTIVSSKPQTTRTRIAGILTRDDMQIIFLDTPGIHRPHHQLGQAMVTAATGAIPDADVILFVVDVSQRPSEEDLMTARAIRQGTQRPVILTLNKMDKLPPELVTEHTEAYWELIPDHASWMMISAIKGENLDKLVKSIAEYLPEGPRFYPHDQITDQTERAIVAELVREQVLRKTRLEVPHAVAVTVEEFKERDSGAFYILANIHVERNSQKSILIGKRGQMLHKIGPDRP